MPLLLLLLCDMLRSLLLAWQRLVRLLRRLMPSPVLPPCVAGMCLLGRCCTLSSDALQLVQLPLYMGLKLPRRQLLAAQGAGFQLVRL